MSRFDFQELSLRPTLRWQRRLSAPLFAAAVPCGDLLVVTTVDGVVQGLDKDGATRWSRKLDGHTFGASFSSRIFTLHLYDL